MDKQQLQKQQGKERKQKQREVEQPHYSRALSTCTQLMQGRWVHGQGNHRDVVWWRGENDLFFSNQLEPLLGDALLGQHLCPKQVVDSWDHLMHARKVRRDQKPYTFKQERKAPNELEFVVEWVVVAEQPIGQWAALKR